MARTHLSSIMKRSHEIARTLEGDYRARMSVGLRQAWAEHRMGDMSIADRLIELGGNEWQKGGHHRIYFNWRELARFRGLEWEIYNTGNISSATKHGEHISNNSARQLLDELRFGKFWYDLNTSRFASRGLGDRAFAEIVGAIRNAADISIEQEVA